MVRDDLVDPEVGRSKARPPPLSTTTSRQRSWRGRPSDASTWPAAIGRATIFPCPSLDLGPRCACRRALRERPRRPSSSALRMGEEVGGPEETTRRARTRVDRDAFRGIPSTAAAVAGAAVSGQSKRQHFLEHL
ncbi:hypothetical protein PR202_ga06476 [Eleusine coracana subsp. coracana]|uniref:Uncharacterized protein n=1 Tax=Eleusine coracana subsp. coracana TaxID=191504 RepID=A0AAV5BXD5_ELECO|nr:hypothetical protein PR202_ga06476 [Eleusine coracana subsp. coracana]